MEMMTLFDVIILIFGIYMIGSGIKMMRTKEPSSVVIAKEELVKCKDPAGMAEFLCRKEMFFGAVFVMSGILGLISDLWADLGWLNIVQLVMFVISFIWFQGQLRKAREKFFRSF